MANMKQQEEKERAEAALQLLEDGEEVVEEVVVNKSVTVEEVVTESAAEVVGKKMLLAAKMLERMVNLDTFDEVAKDYRFYEDPGDEHREPPDGVMALFLLHMQLHMHHAPELQKAEYAECELVLPYVS